MKKHLKLLSIALICLTFIPVVLIKIGMALIHIYGRGHGIGLFAIFAFISVFIGLCIILALIIEFFKTH